MKLKQKKSVEQQKAYLREWKKRNPDKVSEIQLRYWRKRVEAESSTPVKK